MSTTDFRHLDKYLELVERHPTRARALSIGDSWFQYPLRSFPDLQRGLATTALLRKRVMFLDDSYPGRDADEVRGLIRRWQRVARTLADRGKPFDLIALSLGGNDVIGLDFERHLRRDSGTGAGDILWPWAGHIPQVAARHIDFAQLRATFANVFDAYRLIIQMRNESASGATILAHTYAAVTPSSIGYQFLTFKAGPWVYGPATKLGLSAPDQKVLVDWLLESFHGLLRGVQESSFAGRFEILDTRRELADSRWDNEIHPSAKGFRTLVSDHWVPAVLRALS